MKKIIAEFFLGICIFVCAMCLVQPALAHGGEPRLEINLERINPGGTVDIRGVEFDYEQPVTLYLERTGIRVQVGEVVTDVEGIFRHTIVLPVDLPEGVYNVRAATSHHDVLSPSLTVQGSPILEGGGQGERDEDDGLLVPMPTFAPGVSSTPLPQKSTSEVQKPQPEATGSMYPIIFGIGLLGLLGLRILMKR